ncbi:TlpA family protein disulfide reductase [Rubinisphaera sp. JC750]|uniref:TlpA family protein disulfide reductase n=1 Tax=Rubinisphaera sp. JC750 TaxID=2898658 RepID=UPI001F1B47D5|nr:TlpA disulfide reductase family protein [Rubinisphaera sp. JC750]
MVHKQSSFNTTFPRVGLVALALSLTGAPIGCGTQPAAEPQTKLDAPAEQPAEPHPLAGTDVDPEVGDADESSMAEQPILNVRPASRTSMRNDPPGLASIDRLNHLQNMQSASGAQSGSPEWDIQQIAALLAETKQKQAQAGNDQSKLQLTDEQNRRIVALATHAIAQTHDRAEKELVFVAAVHSLMDARLSLALSGDQESIDAIYRDAATLAEEHPDTDVASTAAGAIVRLTRGMAEQGDRESPWVSEYVRQAKLFAANFPSEEARAIVQLTAAAELCERYQLILPAIECFTLIEQKFPNSPFTDRATASLRRLNLVGKTLQLEGPTLNGEQFSIESLRGKPVLIAFWSSRSTAFAEDLPLLNELRDRSGCELVGINMDTHTPTVEEFVATHNLPGQHIFYTDASSQGASQPIARQFGIHTVPTYWLVDKDGKVLSTNVNRPQLQKLIQKNS